MVGLMANLMIGVDISNQDAFCCHYQLTNPRLRTLVLVGVGGPRDLIGCHRGPPPPPQEPGEHVRHDLPRLRLELRPSSGLRVLPFLGSQP